MHQAAPAGVGQPETVVAAVEQLNVELELELVQLPGECRLRDTHPAGRFHHGRGVGDLDKRGELVKLKVDGTPI